MATITRTTRPLTLSPTTSSPTPAPVPIPPPLPPPVHEHVETVDSPLPASRRIPIELVRLCFEHAGDWELATTLGVRSPRLRITSPWLEFATPLDKAILRSSTSLLPIRYALSLNHTTFTQWGIRVMVRFGYLHVLDFFLHQDRNQLLREAKTLLPVVASAWGRTNVLQWAKDSQFRLDPDAMTTAEAIDDASRHGQVAVLDFWLNSGLPLFYTEAALSSATYQRKLGSLEWWRSSGLPLKIGDVLDFASMEGSTICLDWWASSGLPARYTNVALSHLSRVGNVPLLDWWKTSRFALKYSKEVILIATKHGQTEALTWWLESGLDISYKFFDIEEAIEDEVVGRRKEVESWWARLGYDEENMRADDWTKTRNFKTDWIRVKGRGGSELPTGAPAGAGAKGQ